MSVREHVTEDTLGDQDEHIGTVILFLSFAILTACVCKLILSEILKNKIPIPFTVIVLLFGFLTSLIIGKQSMKNNDFLLGEQQLKEINPHLVDYIFLPLLVFDAAFNSHFNVIQHQIIAGILLAGPGVLICMVCIALCAVYAFPYGWSWLDGFLMGSILCTTDTVAIVAWLHQFEATKALGALIDLESLLNDASAFVFFYIFKDIILNGGNIASKVFVGTTKFTVGGPAFGLLCGLIIAFVYTTIYDQIEIQIISTFGISYLVFYIADAEIGVSAVLALVVMGLLIAKHKYCISSKAQQPMTSTWHMIIYFVNITVFFITGIMLAEPFLSSKNNIGAKDFGFAVLLYVALHVARLLTIVLLYPLIRCSHVKLSWKECVVLLFSGLRGTMSVILALVVRSEEKLGDSGKRQRFLFQCCMVSLFTLLINGTCSTFLIRFLGLDQGTFESELVLLQALEHMRQETSEQLSTLKERKEFCDVDWEILNVYLPEKLVQEMDESRRTEIHRRLLASPICLSESITQSRRMRQRVQDVAFIESLTTFEIEENLDAISHVSNENDVSISMDVEKTNNYQHNKNMRNELTIRFLTAFALDYEKQWQLGMIRRSTLFSLTDSIEKAKHQCSLKHHWDSIVRYFQIFRPLHYLLQLNFSGSLARHLKQYLFDHIYLSIEMTLAFYSTRNRMNHIRIQFPELTTTNEEIWIEINREIYRYLMASCYILLDFRQSYPNCWKVQMTRRCAQMLLKFESLAIKQLYETGMLRETEFSHIRGLIEEKIFRFESPRIRLAKDQDKTIEKSFEVLSVFRSLPIDEKSDWLSSLGKKYRFFQSGRNVEAFLWIIRGVVQLKSEEKPIFYRSGAILDADLLFLHTASSNRIYQVIGGPLEAYEIDQDILLRLLEDEYLAKSVYSEIASQFMFHHSADQLILEPAKLKFLLQHRAIFHNKRNDLSLHLNIGERLFILQGETNPSLIARKLHVIDSPTNIISKSTVFAFQWSPNDEDYCRNKKDLRSSFPVDTISYSESHN